jgi:hypothetical protein
MIKVAKETRVFVYCPANSVTGGTELLHQLAHILNNNNIETFIVYSVKGFNVPPEFEKYNVKVADTIIDEPLNVMVINESDLAKSMHIKKAQMIYWWLSVDNFYANSIRKLSLADYAEWSMPLFLRSVALRLLDIFRKRQFYFINTFSIADLVRSNHLNCYQSEYAHQFLLGKGFTNIHALSDYINTELSQGAAQVADADRENIVLYNPKKGLKYVKELMRLAPELVFVPLINLNREGLLSLFRKSKLYIDFGHHPGKDRLPREAAQNGCCVLTGRKGSAKYYKDIAIDDYYKIDESTTEKSVVVERMRDIIANYSKHNQNYAIYRSQIRNEEAVFNQQVMDIFSNNGAE